MGRSYLFEGRDVEHLGPQERQLEALYDRLDRPGHRLTRAQFYKTPEYAEFLDLNFGGLASQVPPGSQIVRQDPFRLEYKDAEGYTHVLQRGAGAGAAIGSVSRQTDRPAILPDRRNREMLDFLSGRVRQGYGAAPALADLDPETAAQLQAISAAERGDIARQASDERGRLVAQLYGNRVNRSSMADEQSARFIEALGRLYQQQQAGAAQRTIGLRQYLTNLLQAQNESAGSLYANLTGQGTQADIAGAGLDVELKRLAEGSRQFNLGNYLDTLRTQIEQEKLDQARSPLNKALAVSQIVANIAGMAGGGLSAYRALQSGRKQAGLPEWWGGD